MEIYSVIVVHTFRDWLILLEELMPQQLPTQLYGSKISSSKSADLFRLILASSSAQSFPSILGFSRLLMFISYASLYRATPATVYIMSFAARRHTEI